MRGKSPDPPLPLGGSGMLRTTLSSPPSLGGRPGPQKIQFWSAETPLASLRGWGGGGMLESFTRVRDGGTWGLRLNQGYFGGGSGPPPLPSLNFFWRRGKNLSFLEGILGGSQKMIRIFFGGGGGGGSLGGREGKRGEEKGEEDTDGRVRARGRSRGRGSRRGSGRGRDVGRYRGGTGRGTARGMRERDEVE